MRSNRLFRRSPAPPPTRDDHVLYEAELAIREKHLIDFVTAKHTGLVNGARARAGEYLLAAHAARNQPPADDFMLLADPGDLNPSMITRWRQFLTDTRKRKHPAFLHWHAVADLPDAEFAAKAPALLKAVTGANKLVAAAFVDAPKSMKDVAAKYGALLNELDKRLKAEDTKPQAALKDPDAEELRRVLYGPDAPADAPLALDWGFLSLFPDRATQGEYQKHLRELENWLAKGPPRAMVLHDAPRPYEPRVFERGHPGRPGEPVPRQSPKIANPHAQAVRLARKRPARPGARDRVEGQPADGPRVREPRLDAPLRPRSGRHARRLRAARRRPTHPELLDWLSSEFMTKGWKVKELHKLIMTSATYTQSSLDRADALAIDSENRLLWKQNRRRLEFEPLHDSVVAVSGQLDAKLGGPSVRLFGGNTRRAVYGYVDRLEFPSLLTTFDVPNPAGLTPERTNTTVAPQALFLMNGPFARDAAKKLVALPAVQKLTDAGERLDRIYLTVYGRKPDADETQAGAGVRVEGRRPLGRPRPRSADDQRVRVRGLKERDMTEAEWERCIDREQLLQFLQNRISTRKVRLFAVACCRQQWELFPNIPHRRLIEAAEQFADGVGTADELQRLAKPLERPWSKPSLSREELHLASAAGALAWDNEVFSWRTALGVAQSVSEAVSARLGDYTQEFYESEREIIPHITTLHDIAGSPFYPEAVEPAWLTSTVVLLARGMYDSHDFSAMPILADALQDAGCDNDIILGHCHAPWAHVRGCWAVDLILGKE